MSKSLTNDLNALASEVFSSMANMCLEPSENADAPELTEYIVSSVHLAGAWEGSVHLDMNIDLARATTARLLGAEETDVTSEDIQDAVGELANMLGGGVKELVPQPCKLSLPSVATGDKRESVIGRGRVASECSFVANSGRLHVSVVENES
jgi:chemotaxis protein CheX